MIISQLKEKEDRRINEIIVWNRVTNLLIFCCCFFSFRQHKRAIYFCLPFTGINLLRIRTQSNFFRLVFLTWTFALSLSQAVVCQVYWNLAVWSLSGMKLTSSSLSAIQVHTRTTCHSISSDDFSSMSYRNSASELLIRESLLISKFRPDINEIIRSVPLALFWFIFFFLSL